MPGTTQLQGGSSQAQRKLSPLSGSGVEVTGKCRWQELYSCVLVKGLLLPLN